MYHVLDFDQTLFHTREALVMAYRGAFTDAGVDVNIEDIIGFEGNSINILFDKFNLDGDTRDRIRHWKQKNYKNYYKFMIPNYDLLSLENKVIHTNASSKDVNAVLNYYNIKDIIEIKGREENGCLKPNLDAYSSLTEFSKNFTYYDDDLRSLLSAKKAGASNTVRVNLDTYELIGGGEDIIRKMGKTVDKITRKNKGMIYLEENNIPVPHIRFYNNEKIIMDYVVGRICYSCYNHERDFNNLLELIKKMSQINPAGRSVLSFDHYIERLKDHADHFKSDHMLSQIFYEIGLMLEEHRMCLSKETSFCHGDFTLNNLLMSTKGDIYVIDSNNDLNWTSWLLDMSKLLQSSRHYEYYFGFAPIKNHEVEKIHPSIRAILTKEQWKATRLLEATHWLRMLKYKKTKSRAQFELARAFCITLWKEVISDD